MTCWHVLNISELYGCSPCNTGELDQIPKQCQFATEVNHLTQVCYSIFNLISVRNLVNFDYHNSEFLASRFSENLLTNGHSVLNK